jgi:endoglucanase
MKPTWVVPLVALASAKFTFYGSNEAGAEFAATVPGIPDKDFAFPNTSAIDILMSAGLNTFRIPFVMERMAPDGMDKPLSPAYLANLTAVVDFVTGLRNDTFAVIDPHNYGRYRNDIITDTALFQKYWQAQATPFANNEQVVFDCNNEPHDMGADATLTARLNQACIDGVRAAGATTQFVFVEGTSYTGAWTWVSSGNGDHMGNLTDPSGKIVYEMHQYLDQDGSGTHEECVNATIGVDRLQVATRWLRENRKMGVLGEFAGGANDQCKQAVRGMLADMSNNTDVWMGWLWWAAGPFWGDYLFSLEPGEGIAFDQYLNLLQEFVSLP